MIRRVSTVLGVLVLLLVCSASARAQLSQYNIPVETAILESHIDLQYQYSKLNLALDPVFSDLNVSLLSLEAQIALKRIELSVNVPFVVHGWRSVGDNTEFGDLMVGFKARLFGDGDNFAVAFFTNAWLPTHTGDFITRKYAQLQGGAVASAKILFLKFGGGIQTFWTFIGEDIEDSGLLGFYGYAQFSVFGLLTLQTAVEYFNSVYPDGDLNAFLVTPAIEFSIIGIHAGVGVRIATTDDAKRVSLGRAALIANAGFRF